jgi:type IV pilus assembly protein PilN
MRIHVNLATRPFVALRPFFARLRLVMAALAVLAIAIGVLAHTWRKKLDASQRQMSQLQSETAHAQAEKAGNERRMRQPQNAAVLERSHFLNALFLRKSFSWTAVMMDLENVLPTGVQVTSIEPQTTSEGDVIIHLRVSGDRDRAIQLVRNLERSRRFLGPHINSESSQQKQDGSGPALTNQAGLAGQPAGVEFEILAGYNPLPAGAPYVRAVKTSANADGVPSHASHTPRTATLRAQTPGPHDGIVLKPYVRPSSGGAR